MKILALTTWCPYPIVNGSTMRNYHLLRALASRHAVDLVTFSAPGAPTNDEVAHLRTFCSAVTVLPQSPFAAVPGARGGLWSSTPRSLGMTDDPAVRVLVAQRASQADMAVGFALHGARYLDGIGVPTVFEDAEPRQIQNMVHHAATLPQRVRLRLTWLKHARYLRRLASSMAAVSVVSDQERRSFVEIGVDASRVHVLPNGADAADLERRRSVAMPARLIYPGAMTYAPNLEAVVWFLAQVLPRVRAARPDVELWVTGDTGTLALDRIPNAAWARFTGRLPDVKDAVGGSEVTVVPLLTGGGTRLKVLESLALGTPVVSTSKGAEGLDLEDGVHLLLADEPDAFAEHVLRILDDSTLSSRLSSAGRARVASHYTWDAIGRRFLDIVDRAALQREHN